jgi:hypothetical protein
MITHSLTEQITSCSWVFEWEGPNTDIEKGDAGEKESQDHAHNFL